MQIISAILAIIPAIEKILEIINQWFPPQSPEDKAKSDLQKAVEMRKQAAAERNQAIKDAKQSYTKTIEDHFNK